MMMIIIIVIYYYANGHRHNVVAPPLIAIDCALIQPITARLALTSAVAYSLPGAPAVLHASSVKLRRF